jgi:hypothetical protein
LVNGGAGSTDNTVFYGESGTAYYLLDTTGWGSAFGGWPTAVCSNTFLTVLIRLGAKLKV